MIDTWLWLNSSGVRIALCLVFVFVNAAVRYRQTLGNYNRIGPKWQAAELPAISHFWLKLQSIWLLYLSATRSHDYLWIYQIVHWSIFPKISFSLSCLWLLTNKKAFPSGVWTEKWNVLSELDSSSSLAATVLSRKRDLCKRVHVYLSAQQQSQQSN